MKILSCNLSVIFLDEYGIWNFLRHLIYFLTAFTMAAMMLFCLRILKTKEEIIKNTFHKLSIKEMSAICN